MFDRPYDKASVPSRQRAIFEQLVSAFPEFEVWQRHQDYGRWLSAGVVNRSVGIAVTVPLIRGGRSRDDLLSSDELQAIREHLTGASEQDLELP